MNAELPVPDDAQATAILPDFLDHERQNKLLTRTEQLAARQQARREHPIRYAQRIIGVTVVSALSLYSIDTMHGYESVQHSESSIITVMDANPDARAITSDATTTDEARDGHPGPQTSKYAQQATLVIAGWGNLSSYATARALAPYAELGPVWALYNDNRGIDIKIIADQVIAKAEAEGIDEVAIHGDSMGGDVGVAVAAEIQESDSNITVPFVELDCAPESGGTLRPSVRDNGYSLLHVLSRVPASRYSSFFRFLGEEAARSSQYTSHFPYAPVRLPGLVRATKQVLNDKFIRNDVASTTLLDEQFKFIVASGAHNNIINLGKVTGKPKPVLIFMGPLDARNDTTVNDELSERLFRDDADEAGLPFSSIKIEGSGHANPIQDGQYIVAVEDSFPLIRQHLDAQLELLGQALQPVQQAASVGQAEALLPLVVSTTAQPHR